MKTALTDEISWLKYLQFDLIMRHDMNTEAAKNFIMQRQTDVIRKSGNNMENIVYREAGIDDAEEMISYLNIVGKESDNLMHGSNGFNVAGRSSETAYSSFS